MSLMAWLASPIISVAMLILWKQQQSSSDSAPASTLNVTQSPSQKCSLLVTPATILSVLVRKMSSYAPPLVSILLYSV